MQYLFFHRSVTIFTGQLHFHRSVTLQGTGALTDQILPFNIYLGHDNHFVSVIIEITSLHIETSHCNEQHN